jgi:hypothetical protein
VNICPNLKLATQTHVLSLARLVNGANGTSPAPAALRKALPHQKERSVVLLLKMLLTTVLNALLWNTLSHARFITAQLTVNTLLGLIGVIARCRVVVVFKLVVALS